MKVTAFQESSTVGKTLYTSILPAGAKRASLRVWVSTIQMCTLSKHTYIAALLRRRASCETRDACPLQRGHHNNVLRTQAATQFLANDCSATS